MTDNGLGAAEVMAMNNGGFGNGGIYWLFFLFLFAFGGWGGNGWNNRTAFDYMHFSVLPSGG